MERKPPQEEPARRRRREPARQPEPVNIVRRRPTETAGAAGALAVLLVRMLGLEDPDLIVALTVVLGAVPAGVTWMVELARSRGVRAAFNASRDALPDGGHPTA